MPTQSEALVLAKQFPLEMRNKKGTNRIDYGDLEQWIKQIFGKDFCFVSTEECGNDSTHDYEDLGEHPDWLDQTEIEEINKWLYENGKQPNYCTRNLLEVLVLQGFLEKGDYIIEVFW